MPISEKTILLNDKDKKKTSVKADWAYLEKIGYELENDNYIKTKLTCCVVHQNYQIFKNLMCFSGQVSEKAESGISLREPVYYVITPESQSRNQIEIISKTELEQRKRKQAVDHGKPTAQLITSGTTCSMVSMLNGRGTPKMHNTYGYASMK